MAKNSSFGIRIVDFESWQLCDLGVLTSLLLGLLVCKISLVLASQGYSEG